MFEYLSKFNQLPENVRASVTGDDAMVVITELEDKYGVDLAAAVMRVMVGEIPLIDLPKFFVFDFNLDGVAARQLTDELTDKIFSRAADYLGIGVEKGIPVEQVEIKPDEEIGPKARAQASNFFFSPEDEEEVRTLAQKLEKKDDAEKPEDEIGEKLNKILVEAKVSFGTEILIDRFINVVRTYLREVRNRIETREALMKPPHVGGLGLDEDEANRVLEIAEKYKNIKKAAPAPVKPPPKVRVAEDDDISIMRGVRATSDEIAEQDSRDKSEKAATRKKKSVIRDYDYDFKAADGAKAQKPASGQPLDVGHELAPPPPATVHEPGSEKPDVAAVKIDVRPQAEVEPQVAAQPIAECKEPEKEAPLKASEREESLKFAPDSLVKSKIRSSQPLAGKVKIEDVKHVPRLEGPVDELKNMDLVNFRRLSRSPIEAASKIKEKIAYLEEDKYSKRVEGVKAWRQSPLNRLYLKIGQDSIAGQKSVDSILKERVSRGEEFLTNEEFEAIMALNKELRF